MISLLFINFSYHEFQLNKKAKLFKEINGLVNLGFKSDALKLTKVYVQKFGHGFDITNYFANQYYELGKYDSSLLVLNVNHDNFCNKEMHLLMGDCYNATKDSINCVNEYISSLKICPHKLLPRKKLMDFYLDRNDTLNSKYWATQLLNTPMKVKTSIGESYYKNAERTINL